MDSLLQKAVEGDEDTVGKRYAMSLHDTSDKTVDFLGTQGFETARFGVILGTGFGTSIRAVDKKSVVPYGSIPHFPVTTVTGHEGNLVFGSVDDVSAIVMQGRVHLYEGYDGRQIAYPLEVMRRFGVEVLLVTNAAGGLNPRYEVGDLMAVRQHVHPIGRKLMGDLTSDMDREPCYDVSLRDSLLEISIQRNLNVQQGILAWTPGPTFETRAEIALLKSLGADAVTMSTVPEALAARRLGMRTAAVSCISNVWTGQSGETVDANDVASMVESSIGRFEDLLVSLAGLIELIGPDAQEGPDHVDGPAHANRPNHADDADGLVGPDRSVTRGASRS